MICVGKIEENVGNFHNEREKKVKYSWFHIWLQTWIQHMSTPKFTNKSRFCSIPRQLIYIFMSFTSIILQGPFLTKNWDVQLMVYYFFCLTCQNRICSSFSIPQSLSVCLQPLHIRFRNINLFKITHHYYTPLYHYKETLYIFL